MKTTLCLVILSLLALARAVPMQPMLSMSNDPKENGSNMDMDGPPKLDGVILVIDYIRPRVDVFEVDSNEETSTATTANSTESSSESGESSESTSTDHSDIEKRNKHKIRYHIKNDYQQF